MEIIADLNIEPQTNEDNIFRNGINYEFKNRYASISDKLYFNYLSQEEVDNLAQMLMTYYNSKSYLTLMEIKEYLKCILNITEINFDYKGVMDLINNILVTNEKGSPATVYLLDSKFK